MDVSSGCLKYFFEVQKWLSNKAKQKKVSMSRKKNAFKNALDHHPNLNLIIFWFIACFEWSKRYGCTNLSFTITLWAPKENKEWPKILSFKCLSYQTKHLPSSKLNTIFQTLYHPQFLSILNNLRCYGCTKKRFIIPFGTPKANGLYQWILSFFKIEVFRHRPIYLKTSWNHKV